MENKDLKDYSRKVGEKKSKKVPMIVCATIIISVLLVILVVLNIGNKRNQPWDMQGKKPSEYTWEEFEALTDEQKLLFSKEFRKGKFEEWVNKVKPQEIVIEEVLPWDMGKKQPDEYTWQEYEVLSGYQQIAFYEWFETREAFDKWLKKAKPQSEEMVEEQMPWEKGGKNPNEYTWEEYEKLSGEQQMKFYYWFGNAEAFDEWLANENPHDAKQGIIQSEQMPWETGGKNPNEYTWEEYGELSGEQQVEFFNWFENIEAFDEWMNKEKND